MATARGDSHDVITDKYFMVFSDIMRTVRVNALQLVCGHCQLKVLIMRYCFCAIVYCQICPLIWTIKPTGDHKDVISGDNSGHIYN